MKIRTISFFCLFGMLATVGLAVERDRYSDMNPAHEQRLEFSVIGSVPDGTKLGRFIIGGWPSDDLSNRPRIDGFPTVLQGMREDGLWANAFLLRLEPAPYLWMSNLSARAASRYDSIGSGGILVAFDQPICAIGVQFAQTGAHNPHHPDLRRRTSFSFFSQDGEMIDSHDQFPGSFIANAAFAKEPGEPPIWAISIDSEVSFAVMEMFAMECAMQLG